MPTTPSRSRTLRQRLRAAATHRFPAKAAALFFALVLWFIVGAEEPTEEWVDARLVLVMDSTVQLRDSIPRVQALVVGRGRELLKLYAARPVIRRVVSADTPDNVNVEFRPSDVDLPSNIDARVRDVRPRSITLRFQVQAQRRVPVRSALDLSAGPGIRITGQPRFEPDSVEVRGPRDDVRAVSSVTTTRARIIVTDTTPRIVALDTARLRLRVVPSRVRVRVPAERDTMLDTAGAVSAGGPRPPVSDSARRSPRASPLCLRRPSWSSSGSG
jgi:hypothetical protein